MDTQKMTLELLATGLTQQELAGMLGCSQSTVNAFSKGNRGMRPSYSIGKKLADLHAALCPANPEKSDLPARPLGLMDRPIEVDLSGDRAQ